MLKKWFKLRVSSINQLIQSHRRFSRRLAESSIEYFDQKFTKIGVRRTLPDNWLIVACQPTGKNSGKHWAYKIYRDNQLLSFGVTNLKVKTENKSGAIERPHIEELERLLLNNLKLYRFNSSSPAITAQSL